MRGWLRAGTASIILVGSSVLETAVYLDGVDVYVACHNVLLGSTDLIKYDSSLSVSAWTVTAIAGANGTFLTVGAHDNEDYVWVARSGASGCEWRAFHKSSGLADTAARSLRNVTIASKIFAKPGIEATAGSLGESYMCVRVAVGENEQEGLLCCGLGTGGESEDIRLRPVAKWLTGK